MPWIQVWTWTATNAGSRPSWRASRMSATMATSVSKALMPMGTARSGRLRVPENMTAYRPGCSRAKRT